MKNKKNKITVFHYARWYPHRYDPMFGLFVQRHAEASSLQSQVGVIYAHAVADTSFSVPFEVDYQLEKGVHAVRVYYPNSKGKVFGVRQLLSLIKFYKACFLGRRVLISKLGQPDLHHVHILTRLALIALFYQFKNGTPYIISEHWSRYLKTGDFSGFLRKWLTRLSVKRAAAITTVTQNLADAMQNDHHIKNNFYQVLANVVDPVFYQSDAVKTLDVKKTFVHVSCFEDKSKNISGLLRAVRLLKLAGLDFQLVLVGDGVDFERLKDYASDLGLDDKFVRFTGLLQGKQLVDCMIQADALVVSSHYENLPVVIIEGFALGLPVIATRVGGISEIVNSSNGILVNPGCETDLAEAMKQLITVSILFDREAIKANSMEVYSAKAVSQKLSVLYLQAMQTH